MKPIASPSMLPHVDPRRWPDIATTPNARARAALISLLMRLVTSRLPVRVVWPDGRAMGPAGPQVAVLRLNRPDAFFRRLGAAGAVGLGESYQAGDCDADDLPGLVGVFASRLDTPGARLLQSLRRLVGVRSPQSEANTKMGARRNIERHYDLSNDLFAFILDDTMTYSSALFSTDHEGAPVASAWSLTEAQSRKVDRLLDIAKVGPGTRLLETGTGWGELAITAARRGALVHTVTLSTAQFELARRRVEQAGLADRVCIELCDYRDISPRYDDGYDAIVSSEMIEAVGAEYWATYFAILDRMLAPGGQIALQSITMPHRHLAANRNTYTWIRKYIFPGGMIPSVDAIDEVCRRHTRLRVHNLQAFGAHYAHTLRLWRERFEEHSADVESLGFDETFRRTWRFYLSYCEAGFSSGHLDVHHLLLNRSN